MIRLHLVRAVGIVTAGGCVAGALSAQVPATPAFDVTSIKPVATEAKLVPGQQSGWLDGGRLVIPRLNVRTLVTMAFRSRDGVALRPEQIVGAPDWTTSTLYAIDAKIANPTRDPVPLADRAPLLQSLLADRFKLAVHFETRDQTIHALVLARSNGALGPNLIPHPVDCLAIAREQDEARRNGQTTAEILAGPNGQTCLLKMLPGSFHGTAVLLRTFAPLIGRQVGMEVVDRTGLTGTFDIDFHYAPEAGRGGPDVSSTPAQPDVATIYTALQEQLGLKIETRHEPGDVLVIDHVEHPAED